MPGVLLPSCDQCHPETLQSFMHKGQAAFQSRPKETQGRTGTTPVGNGQKDCQTTENTSCSELASCHTVSLMMRITSMDKKCWVLMHRDFMGTEVARISKLEFQHVYKNVEVKKIRVFWPLLVLLLFLLYHQIKVIDHQWPFHHSNFYEIMCVIKKKNKQKSVHNVKLQLTLWCCV